MCIECRCVLFQKKSNLDTYIILKLSAILAGGFYVKWALVRVLYGFY